MKKYTFVSVYKHCNASAPQNFSRVSYIWKLHFCVPFSNYYTVEFELKSILNFALELQARGARLRVTALDAGTQLQVCLSRTLSTRRGAPAPYCPAAWWTTGGCKSARRRIRVSSLSKRSWTDLCYDGWIIKKKEMRWHATRFPQYELDFLCVLTCPSAQPIGELRMKSVGARTSTNATASFFSWGRDTELLKPAASAKPFKSTTFSVWWRQIPRTFNYRLERRAAAAVRSPTDLRSPVLSFASSLWALKADLVKELQIWQNKNSTCSSGISKRTHLKNTWLDGWMETSNWNDKIMKCSTETIFYAI